MRHWAGARVIKLTGSGAGSQPAIVLKRSWKDGDGIARSSGSEFPDTTGFCREPQSKLKTLKLEESGRILVHGRLTGCADLCAVRIR